MKTQTKIGQKEAENDKAALRRIQEIMSEQEWNADTFDDIACIMRTAGYEIEDLNQ